MLLRTDRAFAQGDEVLWATPADRREVPSKPLAAQRPHRELVRMATQCLRAAESRNEGASGSQPSSYTSMDPIPQNSQPGCLFCLCQYRLPVVRHRMGGIIVISPARYCIFQGWKAVMESRVELFARIRRDARVKRISIPRLPGSIPFPEGRSGKPSQLPSRQHAGFPPSGSEPAENGGSCPQQQRADQR
jgi:hypothetical protein